MEVLSLKFNFTIKNVPFLKIVKCLWKGTHFAMIIHRTYISTSHHFVIMFLFLQSLDDNYHEVCQYYLSYSAILAIASGKGYGALVEPSKYTTEGR